MKNGVLQREKGPLIFNVHGIPKQCPECGGGLIRKRISDTKTDLVCALCGIVVGSLQKEAGREAVTES
jgi:uncharacterized protein (DUF983 family)